MAISAPPAPSAPPATRSAEAVTDSELVAAVRRGCDRAFEQLYERYHRRIAAYIYGMVNDYGRAEDISQDVFMSALRRMRGTDRPIAFKPWVYEIAKNACIDQFRRARRGEEVSYDAEDGLAATERSRLVTTAPSPAAQVDQKADIDNLRGAFGGLSQTHHEILVLREFEGLSYREIGERLGMSRASVESTLFRARRRLTEEYEELVSGERCRRVQGLIVAADGAVPGARNQRRLSAHLSHCQPCRRHARTAGLDEALFAVPRGVRAKIAAVFPLPAFLQRRWGADPAATVPAPSSSFSTLTQLSAQYGMSIDPAVASWAKAVAAAATIAVAGAAGGAAVSDESRELFGGSTPSKRDGSASRRTAAPAAAPRAARAASTAIAPSGAAGLLTSKGAPARTTASGSAAPAASGATASGAGSAAPAGASSTQELAPGGIVGALSPKPSEPASTSGGTQGSGTPAVAVQTAGTKVVTDAAAAATAVTTDKGQLEGTLETGAVAVGETVGKTTTVVGGR